MEEKNINVVAGIQVLSTSIEDLICDSERLSIIRDYVNNTTYIDKQTLLVLLGELPTNKTETI